ncbi:hypothetical protein RJT34_22459 [Clitoria ternatea]|uniref:Uncharacterized protein n=1 Tax=Clitoria ternatea TaxID=43366 RepID=A0AAN9FLF4_CLITE
MVGHVGGKKRQRGELNKELRLENRDPISSVTLYQKKKAVCYSAAPYSLFLSIVQKKFFRKRNSERGK